MQTVAKDRRSDCLRSHRLVETFEGFHRRMLLVWGRVYLRVCERERHIASTRKRDSER